MRSIEEIVRTILNSDALMEKVNHVVEIERMKYNRGWSTETDIDNFSPIGFRKVVTSAMNLLGLQNESDEVDIASEILKDIFRNEIIKRMELIYRAKLSSTDRCFLGLQSNVITKNCCAAL